MLTGTQKRYLRSRAMTMRALLNVGKGGLTPTFVAGVAAALDARELVKLSLLPAVDEPAASIATALATALPGVEVAQVIGRTIVLYREAPEPENRQVSVAMKELAPG